MVYEGTGGVPRGTRTFCRGKMVVSGGGCRRGELTYSRKREWVGCGSVVARCCMRADRWGVVAVCAGGKRKRAGYHLKMAALFTVFRGRLYPLSFSLGGGWPPACACLLLYFSPQPCQSTFKRTTGPVRNWSSYYYYGRTAYIRNRVIVCRSCIFLIIFFLSFSHISVFNPPLYVQLMLYRWCTNTLVLLSSTPFVRFFFVIHRCIVFFHLNSSVIPFPTYRFETYEK